MQLQSQLQIGFASHRCTYRHAERKLMLRKPVRPMLGFPAPAVDVQAVTDDALYESGTQLQSFLSKKLRLHMADHGGLGFHAEADIAAGEKLLVIPPIEAVWSSKAGEQPNLAALLEALIPYLCGSKPHSGTGSDSEVSRKSEWMSCLFSGSSGSASNNNSDGNGISSTRPASSGNGGNSNINSSSASDSRDPAGVSAHTQTGRQATPAVHQVARARFERVQQLLLFHHHEKHQQQDRVSSHAHASASTSPTRGAAESVAAKVIEYNAYSTRAQEFAAAHLRGVASQQLGGFCGVWPIFSVFNHSCVPNTAFFTVSSSAAPDRFCSPSNKAESNSTRHDGGTSSNTEGSNNDATSGSSNSSSTSIKQDGSNRQSDSDSCSQNHRSNSKSTSSSSSSNCITSPYEPHLIMHAARSIKAGEPVTVTYIGPQLLQPVEARRVHLQASYGFECRCPRCSYESQVPEEARETMQTLALNAQIAQEAIGECLGPELCGDQEVLETAQAALNHVRREFAFLCRQLGLMSTQDSCALDTDGNSSTHTAEAACLEQREQQQLHWLQASYFSIHSPTVADRTDLADVEKAIQAWGKENQAEGPLPTDSAIFEGARSIIQTVAPGSDLHIALVIQCKFCAERLLGALGARAVRKGGPQSSHEDSSREEEEGWGEVVAWLQAQLDRADAAAERALLARYGKLSQACAERLLWLNAAERLPKPLLQLCWAYRERRLNA